MTSPPVTSPEKAGGEMRREGRGWRREGEEVARWL